MKNEHLDVLSGADTDLLSGDLLVGATDTLHENLMMPVRDKQYAVSNIAGVDLQNHCVGVGESAPEFRDALSSRKLLVGCCDDLEHKPMLDFIERALSNPHSFDTNTVLHAMQT